MKENELISKKSKKGGTKYSGEFKLYVIMYMREHHLTNKAAKRLFLPNQKGKSAKTIREWLYVYHTKGPGGFFPMNNDKQTVSYDKTSLQGKSNEELIEIINNLQMKVDVYSEIEKLLKKKNHTTSQIKKKLK